MIVLPVNYVTLSSITPETLHRELFPSSCKWKHYAIFIMKTIARMNRKLSKITEDLALITGLGLISVQSS